MAPKYKKAKSVQERRNIRRMQELQKAQDQEDEIDEIEDDAADEVSDPAAEALAKQLEEIEKDYGGEMVMPMPGPTSFEELDAAEAAQEQAQEVQETSWDAQRLVYNIINHPEMDVKAKSDAFQKVGAEFGKRVSEVLSAPPDTEQKDLDLLSVESVIAYDKRNTGVISQWIDKAVLSTSARKKLTPEQFALPSKKKYPIHDKAHVRNALARAAQEMKAGGASAADAKAAMPAIHAAAKRMGIGMSMKKDRTAIVVEKDATGNWRWVGWASNNFEDTDHDIIAEVAHKEYVEYLDTNPAMAPGFLTWHTPDTIRKSLPDFWTYENGFLIFSGQLTEKEAGNLLQAATLTDLGMSHGSIVLARDPINSHVITKYRMYEVSDLPLENAANPFTALETLSKEADMDKKEYLAQFVGKERAEELIAQTAIAQKELKDAGIVNKEATAAPVPDPVTPEPVIVPAAVDETVVKELMTRLTKDLDIQGLNEFVTKAQEAMEKVPLLETALKELQGSEDEHLAAKISPPATTFAWSHRASESPDNVVKAKEKVGEEPTPGEFWLSDATGTTPVPSSK